MKKQKKQDSERENIRIRKITTKRLKLLKIHLDMKTYDEAINFLADKEERK